MKMKTEVYDEPTNVSREEYNKLFNLILEWQVRSQDLYLKGGMEREDEKNKTL